MNWELNSGRIEPPRGIYVHIPFCSQRCGYCNFALVANRDYLIDDFLKCLETEIELVSDKWNREGFDLSSFPLESLFLGGGTPSHLTPTQFNQIIEVLRCRFDFAPELEFTIEANPNDVNPARCAGWEAAGVNRFSLGAQSFDREKLEFLERTHRGKDIEHAVELCCAVSRNLSLDLIFGSAREELESWKADLESAMRLGIKHLSTYGLTIEKGTRFGSRAAKGESLDVDDEASARLYEAAQESARDHGMAQYEISSFAIPGYECRHNRMYWNLDSYLAFGPGAASFDGQTRVRNHESVSTYLKKLSDKQFPIQVVDTLDAQLLAKERLIFGMRQIAGVNRHEFEEKVGVKPESLIPPSLLDSLLENQLIQIDENLRLTARGVLVSDAIWVQVLAD